MRWKPLTVVTIVLILAYSCWVVVYNMAKPAYKPVSSSVPVKQCSPDAKALVSKINTERSRLGEAPLELDRSLVAAANQKVTNMIEYQYYGHNFPDGSTDTFKFVRGYGVNAAVSEDLDFNALNPTEDWGAFKNSPPHYESLTNATYTRIGAVEECVNYTVKHATGPDDNTNLIGTQAKELTVVYVAGDEPSTGGEAY